MELQSYQEKSDLLLANRFPVSDSVLVIKPVVENLNFSDLHEICKCENIIVLPAPKSTFNVFIMKNVTAEKFAGVHDPSTIVINTKIVQYNSLDEFFEYIKDKTVFFYTGTVSEGVYSLRYEAYPKSFLSPFIDRLNAIDNLVTKLNFSNDVETVQTYVNSPDFSRDKLLVATDFTEKYKELYEYFGNEDEKPQYLTGDENRVRLIEGLPINE